MAEPAVGGCAGDSGAVAVDHQVSRQAAETPDALAVADERTTWRYRDLDNSADTVATYLAAAGVVLGDGVAVRLPKSAELLATYLGIWRAGGHAVLLDPAWPGERARSAIGQARAVVTVCQESDPPLGPAVTITPGELDDSVSTSVRCAPSPHPASVAYIVFTSGSTGTPKGVGVTHRSVSHCAWTHRIAHRVVPHDRSAWLAPPGTSSAVGEIWPYLVTGAAVQVPPADTLASARELQRWLLDRAVTAAYVSMPLAERLYSLLWPDDSPLRLMTAGSDSVRRWAEPGLPFEVAVSFGSAEANGISSGLVPWNRRLTSRTADATTRARRPPVGRPWPDVDVRVTAPDLTEVAPSRIGELTVAGPELANGYVNDPALTATRFVPDPFAVETGARRYRTGDLCEVTGDGWLFHHGRRDRQLKIRGHRLDPTELEGELVHVPGVEDAVVVGEPGPDGLARLAAYLVCAPTNHVAQLRGALAVRLPQHAVPTRWVRLAELPRNSSGKVQLDQLVHTPGEDLAATSGDPTAAAEDGPLGMVLTLWRRELAAPTAGPDDDFFDLGGDSLLAAALVEGLADTLAVRLRLRDIFTHSTPRRLAARIVDVGRPTRAAHRHE